MSSMIIEKSSNMTATRRLIDRVATWLAWLAWLALLIPTIRGLWGADGARTTKDGIAAATQQPTLEGIGLTMLISIVVVVCVVGGWSFYNRRRNRRAARGGSLGWLCSRRVAEFYAVDLRQLFSWQQSRRLVVTHDDGGSVHHVDAEKRPLAATAVVTREQPPLLAANEEATPTTAPESVGGNVVSLTLPAPDAPTIRKSPDVQPTRLTYNGRVYYI